MSGSITAMMTGDKKGTTAAAMAAASDEASIDGVQGQQPGLTGAILQTPAEPVPEELVEAAEADMSVDPNPQL